MSHQKGRTQHQVCKQPQAIYLNNAYNWPTVAIVTMKVGIHTQHTSNNMAVASQSRVARPIWNQPYETKLIPIMRMSSKAYACCR